MNHWLSETVAETKREEVSRVMREIRLEEEAEKGSADYPGRFERMMISLGLWMVTFGERLQKRYTRPQNEYHMMHRTLSARPH